MAEKQAKKQGAIEKFKESQRVGAKRALLEDIFEDYHEHRVQVYKMNFVRGLLFGFGSALGGTLVLALVIWILLHIPGVSEFIRQLQLTRTK